VEWLSGAARRVADAAAAAAGLAGGRRDRRLLVRADPRLALEPGLVDLDALDGRRALLHTGWSGFGDAPLPANVRAIGHVSHDRLFPKIRRRPSWGRSGSALTPNA
jgi:hypothetical protein